MLIPSCKHHMASNRCCGGASSGTVGVIAGCCLGVALSEFWVQGLWHGNHIRLQSVLASCSVGSGLVLVRT